MILNMLRSSDATVEKDTNNPERGILDSVYSKYHQPSTIICK